MAPLICYFARDGSATHSSDLRLENGHVASKLCTRHATPRVLCQMAHLSNEAASPCMTTYLRCEIE